MRQRFRSTRSIAPLSRRDPSTPNQGAARIPTTREAHVEELSVRLNTIADRVDGASLPRLAADLRAVCAELKSLPEVPDPDPESTSRSAGAALSKVRELAHRREAIAKRLAEEAVRLLAARAHVVAEGAGALALAAALRRDDRCVCIVSGGNIDADLYARIISPAATA